MFIDVAAVHVVHTTDVPRRFSLCQGLLANGVSTLDLIPVSHRPPYGRVEKPEVHDAAVWSCMVDCPWTAIAVIGYSVEGGSETPVTPKHRVHRAYRLLYVRSGLSMFEASSCAFITDIFCIPRLETELHCRIFKLRVICSYMPGCARY